MTAPRTGKPYERLLSPKRFRVSKIKGRLLDEEADADRGRVLFCAPFRRLQNKAQVFSLETNAAVRSRLTHSLEVSSIGRFVAQQAIKALGDQIGPLGIAGRERAMITFVETACLLHDLGNPPFGHFGELAISDWFHLKAAELEEALNIGGAASTLWNTQYADFRHFDGNPQGFRIITRLQPSASNDLTGLNLTATTLAATLKYPWDSTEVGQEFADGGGEKKKKAGFFQTERDVVEWIRKTFDLRTGSRHPLVYLMEAADDIAYCVSDIEDGIEKGLIAGPQFASFMLQRLNEPSVFKDAMAKNDPDALRVRDSLEDLLSRDGIEKLTAMREFRSAVIRFLAYQAGAAFQKEQQRILSGEMPLTLLRSGPGAALLDSLKRFAVSELYSSNIVRNREITAQAVLWGLLDAYLPIMLCNRNRFELILRGERKDDSDQPIARESSLMGRISKKYLAVFNEAVRLDEEKHKKTSGSFTVCERLLRTRLIVDHISGMTDEFALQSFQLISGMQVNPHRNS